MKPSNLFFVVVIFFGNYDLCYCLRILQITPGPPTMHYYDSAYFEDVVIKTRRTQRRGDLALNVEFTNKMYWGNNISTHFIFYEYLHNEYRRSFVEMHFKLCDLILNDNIVGSVIRKYGIKTCPVPPGRYRMMNMTFNREFPSVWPFEKGKGEIIFNIEPSGKEVARADAVLTFQMKTKY